MEFSLSFILIPFTSVSFESLRSSDTGKHFADIEKNVPRRDQILDFTFICTGIIGQLVFQMLMHRCTFYFQGGVRVTQRDNEE